MGVAVPVPAGLPAPVHAVGAGVAAVGGGRFAGVLSLIRVFAYSFAPGRGV